MLFVLLVIFVAIIVAGFFLYDAGWEGAGTSIGIIGVVLTIVVIIGFVCTIGGYVSARTLDEQITMYETENAVIEKSVSQTVTAYMEYEKVTFSSLSLKNMDTKDVTTLVSLFPTLVSDTLVKSQLETMVANNNQIKTLKEQKITSRTYGWWLFFASVNK